MESASGVANFLPMALILLAMAPCQRDDPLHSAPAVLAPPPPRDTNVSAEKENKEIMLNVSACSVCHNPVLEVWNSGAGILNTV